ncbi:glycoside hydrolase [Cohnella terricola]|uniref:Glycoside hydrolase n=1 Tax=Cohnella terricola TaxID=1289167 RepID=A0A559J7S2_9BACL|nr:glycoside hydrolase [Cohnella terricola]TVX95938.1 glycoside hydrolase [Cohnella terricola]
MPETILNRKWKLFVIHHSHTDIGYTERQEKIERYHVDFIRQALRIWEEAKSGKRNEWKGFKWTCETFWAVERFLEKASLDEKERFADALRDGDIELSGTYLNLSELIGYDTLAKKLQAAGNYAQSIGVSVNASITADVNGYSWGYSQALYDAGIQNLYSCVHTHHGMFPIGRKQTPFYWETPRGDKVLVWNGEHYMIGNDLGLLPNGSFSYTIQDEFYTNGAAEDHWKLAETRIQRYLEQLESESYPYDFAIVNVSGLLTDNAPPSGTIMEFIQEWNEKHGDRIEIEMTTLHKFFEHVRTQSFPIPVYKGDWPDWWTDGTISTAVHTQVFRDAQRTMQLAKTLSDTNSLLESRISDAEHQLMMYAEHTWGYHSSIYEPWHPMVHALAVRKEAYAANASRQAYEVLDDLLYGKGAANLAAGLPFRYKVINPYEHPVRDTAQIYLENWEPSLFTDGFEVYEETSGLTVPHQLEKVSRGHQITIYQELASKEERYYRIRPQNRSTAVTTSSIRLMGLDRVDDLLDLYPAVDSRGSANGIMIAENVIKSPFVCIRWDGNGIFSCIDKVSGREMIRTDAQHRAFTPVYELTKAPSESQMADVRRRMGRNRKGIDVQRHVGKWSGANSVVQGELYGVVELKYLLEGTSYYSLYLKVYRDMARVDVSVRLHKNSVWDPENVYISLPFGTDSQNEQVWLDKAGAPVRPGIDQLPGTLIDYYCVQEGYAHLSDRFGLLVSTPDTPLIQTGSLEYETRLLNGQGGARNADRPLYSWVLSNYWETNFKATLGGFYEFQYKLQWGEEWDTPEKAFQKCLELNTELPAFRTKEPGNV